MIFARTLLIEIQSFLDYLQSSSLKTLSLNIILASIFSLILFFHQRMYLQMLYRFAVSCSFAEQCFLAKIVYIVFCPAFLIFSIISIIILQFSSVLIVLLQEFYHFISNFYYFQFHH